jgi:hypothetical protein
VSRRLTAAELAEPDVTLEIPYGKFAALPNAVRKHLELYIPKECNGPLIYRIPAYLAREWGAIPAAMPAVATSEPVAALTLADQGSRPGAALPANESILRAELSGDDSKTC